MVYITPVSNCKNKFLKKKENENFSKKRNGRELKKSIIFT